MACVLIRKSENQTRVSGSTKEGHVTFMKNHASSFTKIRSWRIANVKGRFLSFETYWDFFRILILGCKFTFILIVVVVIELTFVPFQQPHHCLLVYSWGNRKSRGFCYSVFVTRLRHLAGLGWRRKYVILSVTCAHVSGKRNHICSAKHHCSQ